MSDAERAQLAREILALGCGHVDEPLPQLAAARVDPQLAARLGIHQPEVADVRQLLLALVSNLDRDDVVT